MLALRVTNLSWQVANEQVLSHIHFTVDKGSMLGVIGPNGAGKSSLLRCLYRFIVPTEGRIEIFGQPLEDYSAQSLAQHVAVVQQDTPVTLDVTTEQLIAMGLTPHKAMFARQTAHDDALITHALEQVGLTHKAKQKFNQLSGGEKQRALIARAIVQRPQLLILDEPTNHLDIRYQIQILELVKSLGITVIASIHDLNLASAMCDQLLLLKQGTLKVTGEPEQVLTETQISQVFDVCCQVTPHPQHGNPCIQYFYGYQSQQTHTTTLQGEAS
ncbi:ABC transporter ATP-binding protein [Shewanella maritima]|uniref:ABC transporter ATP-binding protein n=1 Tax=Shewanella maritima TaxID=2520507 RepID=UPI003734EC26